MDNKSKRLAKNTILLYFRQILIMLVGLYTVRIVLTTLGAEDYGIYNVISGVVVLFSFINNAMVSGTQRFLNYYLGKNDIQKAQDVYSSSLIIYLFVSIIFIIIAESIGLWFVYYKLNIPSLRRSAALIVYQFTIITTVFSIMRVPYNAMLIAYEKMSFFALFSIIEVTLKLVIVFILLVTQYDKLITYSFLLSLIAFIITGLYLIYCKRTFEIAHFRKVRNIDFVKEQLSFSGWSFFGSLANVLSVQGTNLVLNIFTNVTINAAMGIANQVNSAVYSFVSNFQTAFYPQIVKTYAENNKKYFLGLISRTSKISFYLLSFIAVPLLVNTNFVLTVWLKNIPDYSVSFVQLILLLSLTEAWNGPLWGSVQATGIIKKYQIIVSSLIILNLPLTIIAFALKAPPESILLIRIIINLFITIWRINYLHNLINLPRRDFILNVLLRSIIIFLISLLTTKIFGKLFENAIIYFFLTCIFSVIINIILILILGLTKDERIAVFTLLRTKIRKPINE